MSVHGIQQGGQENGSSSNKGHLGQEGDKVWVETGPLGFKAGVQLGCDSVWLKKAIGLWLLSLWAVAAAGALCPAAGDVSAVIRASGSFLYCLFSLVSSSRALSLTGGWEILSGENLGVFGWEEEIWGHSCNLYPFKGALWTEEQTYYFGLQRATLRLEGGSNREAEKSTRFEIKFQIKHVLSMFIGKLLMSLNLNIHICKRRQTIIKLHCFKNTVRDSNLQCWK